MLLLIRTEHESDPSCIPRFGLEIIICDSPCLLACFLFDVTGLLAVNVNGMNLALHCQFCQLNGGVTNAFSYQDKVAIKTNQYSGSSLPD